MIFEFILEMLGYLIVDLIIGNLFRLFRKIGLLGLKMITVSELSLTLLDKKYQDSSLPSWIGFIFFVGIICLLIKVI